MPVAEPPAAGVRERKVVSVLFCDLVGFTAASERRDPEDVQRRLQAYHSRLRQHIEAFGGTVEKFIDDAVMAVFGAPVAHEDAPERAVRAALRIIEVFADADESDLVVRIGVNTGEGLSRSGGASGARRRLARHSERGNNEARDGSESYRRVTGDRKRPANPEDIEQMVGSASTRRT
jgi:class 3 adenylate cyclase